MHRAKEQTAANMRRAAAILSEMLAHTAAETRRLQRMQEKALGRRYETGQELKQDYDPDEMKDLTALLKDIAAVTKALDERGGEEDGRSAAGVLVLPAADLEEEGARAFARETEGEAAPLRGEEEST